MTDIVVKCKNSYRFNTIFSKTLKPGIVKTKKLRISWHDEIRSLFPQKDIYFFL